MATSAHGCRAHYGLQGQYESATKTFEKSVNVIQKMLGNYIFELIIKNFP